MEEAKTPWPALLKKAPVIQVYETVERVEKAFLKGEKEGQAAYEKAVKHGEAMGVRFDVHAEVLHHLRPCMRRRGGQALAAGLGITGEF